MRILVFGGTGFVGLNIAAVLLVRGHAVTGSTARACRLRQGRILPLMAIG